VFLYVVIQIDNDPDGTSHLMIGGIFSDKEAALKFFYGPNNAYHIEVWKQIEGESGFDYHTSLKPDLSELSEL
jgi:hypothetical protein